MSYRLISRALFVVTSADGKRSEREVEVRAYGAPKRDAAGLITVDGVDVPFRRTGGKGRGTADHRYAYATVKATMGFWALTEAEATAMVGGKCSLTCVEAKAEDAPKADAKPAVDAKQAQRIKGVKATA